MKISLLNEIRHTTLLPKGKMKITFLLNEIRHTTLLPKGKRTDNASSKGKKEKKYKNR